VEPTKQTESSAKTEVLHPEEVVTTLLLIRHGDTQATERKLLYTDPAAELTEKGIAQAQRVAQSIAKLRPDVVLCSTAKRVVDTARIIAGVLECEPVLYNDLSEWHVGEWEGRSYLDIKKNDPELYKSWSRDPIRNRPPGGESIADLRDRVAKHIDELRVTYAGKTVALVTHAGIIRSILITSLGMPVDNFWRIAVPVGSISRVDLSSTFATVQFVSVRPE
jgi:broad specificity phosphatase PhoE